MSHTKNFTLKSGAVVHAVFSEAYGKSDALPVLCLSGFGCTHYNFLPLLEELGPEVPLVLLDNKGMGKSSPATDEYTLDVVADEAIEVMDLLKAEKFHLMGISMGGFLSQLIALKAPEKLASLGLYCTTSGGEDFIALPPLTEEGLRLFYSVEEPKRTEMAVAATVHPDLPMQNPELFQKICEVRRSHPVDVEQVLMQKRAVDQFLAKSWPLETIETPTFILTGAEDRFVNPQNAQLLHKKIRNSQLREIPQCDHFFFFEKQREMGAAVREFLQGVNK